MVQYTIEVRNEKKKGYQVLSWLLLVLEIAMLAVYAVSDSSFLRNYRLIGILVIITIFLYYRAKKPAMEGAFTYAFLAAALTWFMTAQYIFAAFSVLFVLLYHLATRKIELHFYANKIVSPGLAGREFGWDKFSNIILKDGLLTLDFQNNRISQYHVDDEKGLPDEQEFNEFCKRQLAMAATDAGDKRA